MPEAVSKKLPTGDILEVPVIEAVHCPMRKEELITYFGNCVTMDGIKRCENYLDDNAPRPGVCACGSKEIRCSYKK